MSVVDTFGVNGHLHMPGIVPKDRFGSITTEFFKAEGSNDRGGSCSFESYPTLKAALEELPRQKAENPMYTTWLIERFTPCVDISVAWRQEQEELPPGVVKVAMMDRFDD